jgi:hypothetical protein
MTVPPVSDLIGDVMAAADPTVQRVATNKLERLTPMAGQNFAASINEKIDASKLSQPGPQDVAARTADGTVISDIGGHAPVVRKSSDGSAVYRKFEAFILQMFVESMLPKGTEDLYGKGTAGTVWRSMLAEQIGNEMAKGNGIGIAKQLAKSRASASATGNES